MLVRHSDLPLARDDSGRFLPWLIAFMVYLAALAATSAIAMQKVAARWDQGLAGRFTVQVPPPESGAETVADIKAVLELLANTPGVASAEVLDESEVGALLEPWLGAGVMEQNLPLPRLIAVVVAGDSPPDPAALSARLSRIAPGTVVDDHQRWLGNLLAFARTIELVSILVVIAVGAIAVVSVVFVTRTGLSIHRQVIDLLHLIGAHDTYIARQFQLHALDLGLRGGLIGLGLAMFTVLLLGFLMGRSDSSLLPDLSLSFSEWLVLLLLPLATALIAMVTAWFTVLRTLSRLP